MGNNQSSEASLGQRKLSKPPNAHSAAAQTVDHTDNSTSHQAQFSNSYLVGSVPPSPTKVVTNNTVSVSIGIAVPGDDCGSPPSPPTYRNVRRDSNRWSGAPRSQSINSNESRSRSNNIPGNRNNSVKDVPCRPMTRTERFVNWCPCT